MNDNDDINNEWTPCMKLPVVVHVRKQRPGETHVSTREGITPVKPDDLIMRGVEGEEYPIGRDLFNKTYTTDLPTEDYEQDEGQMFTLMQQNEELVKAINILGKAFRSVIYDIEVAAAQMQQEEMTKQ